MQVTGKFSNVVNKVKVEGVPALYHGSLAAASATFVGHYPWYVWVVLFYKLNGIIAHQMHWKVLHV